METSDYDKKLPGISLHDKERAKNVRFEVVTEISKFQIDFLLKDNIITKRNIRMARRIDEIVKESPKSVIFTAIGTGHFLGDQSILTHLRKLGYIIQPIRDEDSM